MEYSESSPEVRLMRLANAFQLSRAVQVAARLRLGHHLRAGRSSAEALARATGTDPRTLERLLRFLAQLGVVTEVADGGFAPTPLSDRLDLVDNVAQGDEGYRAWGALELALASGIPSFEQVHGEDFYGYVASHPAQGASWRRWNAWSGAAVGPRVSDALDLAGDETVVDVGGGSGAVLAAVLKLHPRARGVLCDLPAALDGARELLAGAGVESRCRIHGWDAAQGLPEGGDVYLLCRVLSNLGDRDASGLLASCRRALGPRGRLLVVDVPMPDAGPGRHALGASDLNLFLLWGGGHRSRGELEALLSAAGLTVHGWTPVVKGAVGPEALEVCDARLATAG